jgi:hypothetical protein
MVRVKYLILKLLEIPALWFEILLALSCIPGLFWLSIGCRRLPRWLRILTLLSLFGGCAELLIEGYRWQMAPIGIVFVSLVALNSVYLRHRITYHRLLAGLASIALFIGVALQTILPPIGKSSPTGTFAVGMTVLHLIDGDRPESLNPTVHGPRELMVEIWYPANRSAQPRNSKRWLERVERFFGLPSEKYIRDATVSKAQSSYPVLIFSPSWHGQRGQNTFQVEELVSHGFVVVGIDHSYSSAITVFPDGRIARAQLLEWVDLSSDETLRASFRYDEKVLRVRVQDVEFVVEELEKLSSPSSSDKFSGRLDFNRLGIFGYSFGGAVAAQSCWLDHKFKAGLDLDGTMFGEVAEAGVHQPFAFLVESTNSLTVTQLTVRDPEKRRYAWLNERDFYEQRNSTYKHGGYWLGIRGTQHVNFTDPPTIPTLGYYVDGAGTIKPSRAMHIINAYTLAFFEKHLNQLNEPLLNGPSSVYPEVIFASPLAQSARLDKR